MPRVIPIAAQGNAFEIPIVAFFLSAMKGFPICYQLDSMDCGPACIQMIAKYYGREYSQKELREKSFSSRSGATMQGLSSAAKSIGFRTTGVKINWTELSENVTLPIIAHWRQNHFVVVYKIKKSITSLLNGDRKLDYSIYVADPARGKLRYKLTEFLSGWLFDRDNINNEGHCLLIAPTNRFYANSNGAGATNELKSYLKNRKLQVLGLAFLLLISASLEMSIPILIQNGIDRGVERLPEGPFQGLLLLSLITIVVGTSTLFLLRRVFEVKLVTDLVAVQASNFIARLTLLPITFFEKRRIGDVLHRIDDNNKIGLFLVNTGFPAGSAILNVVFFTLVLAYYNLVVSLLSILFEITCLLFLIGLHKRKSYLENHHYSLLSSNGKTPHELVEGITEIKMNNLEDKFQRDWEKMEKAISKVKRKGYIINGYLDAGVQFISNLRFVVLAIYTTNCFMNHELSLGALLAIQLILINTTNPSKQIADAFTHIQGIRISLQKLGEIQNETAEYHNNSVAIEGANGISFKNVFFSYGGPKRKYVFENLSLNIAPGNVTAIVGSSGSGKSTLLKLMMGLYSPAKGAIYVGNRNLNGIDCTQWRSYFYAVNNENYIFSESISRNIALCDDNIDMHKLENAIRLANLNEFIQSLPTGYNTLIGENGLNMSGGQKQCLLIARAIYRNPEMLLLDEATNSMDSKNESIVLENLFEFFRGKTIIIVAHRLNSIIRSDNIVVLKEGKFVEEGTHRELMERRAAYYELFNA